MRIDLILSFLRSKCKTHFRLKNVGPVEVEQPHPGWSDLTHERHSFILVTEGKGYRVSVEPVELAT